MHWLAAILAILLWASSAQATRKPPIICLAELQKTNDGKVSGNYSVGDIAAARFGAGPWRALLERAHRFTEIVGATSSGLDLPARATQNRLIQYSENIWSRANEPVAIHYIGPPGIGKSKLMLALGQLGVPALSVDSQHFDGDSAWAALSNFATAAAANQLNDHHQGKTPLFLLVDELDKIAELRMGESGWTEKTNPFIGFFNDILTRGKGSHPFNSNVVLDFSNVFVASAMNLSPVEYEEFSKEALKTEKSFYDFTLEDFDRFYQWLIKRPAAIAKILSKLFRSNTLSRIAPNAVIVPPPTAESLRAITRMQIQRALTDVNGSIHGHKHLGFTCTPQFIDYMAKLITYAPVGVRSNIYLGNSLPQQLASIAARVSLDDDGRSLSQPRQVHLSVARGHVQMDVTQLIRTGETVREGAQRRIPVRFDHAINGFSVKEDLLVDVTRLPSPRPEKLRPFSEREIRRARYPEQGRISLGLAEKIEAAGIYDQRGAAVQLEDMIVGYKNQTSEFSRPPQWLILAGFSGIGKSVIAETAAHESEIPVVRVNLQLYGMPTDDSASNFLHDLQSKVQEARKKSKDGKIMVIFDEMDKIYEIDPQTGHYRAHPVIAFIKDLLRDGTIDATISSGTFNQRVRIDLRDSIGIITMNFATDRFGFVADPRVTTLQDMYERWQHISTYTADLHKILKTLFTTDTIRRMLPYFYIMPPLTEEGFRKVIRDQVRRTHETKYPMDRYRDQRKGLIELETTPQYLDYLYQQSVIPSEQAGGTVSVVNRIVSADLAKAVAAIPKGSSLGAEPVTIWLHYLPGSNTVVASATPVDEKRGSANAIELFRKQPRLSFPSLAVKGRMPEERVQVSIHEFGHALTAALTGHRFQNVLAAKVQDRVGGMVALNLALLPVRAHVTYLYTLLGARAMERLLLRGDHPTNGWEILDGGVGGSRDVEMATEELWFLLSKASIAPTGGTLAREGVISPSYRAHFEHIPHNLVERYGKVLRAMEDRLIELFRETFTTEELREKIKALARAGVMSEREFYTLLGFKYDNSTDRDFGMPQAAFLGFDDIIEKLPREYLQAAKAKRGKQTAQATTDMLMKFFGEQIEKHVSGKR